jgi:hypothetical protein
LITCNRKLIENIPFFVFFTLSRDTVPAKWIEIPADQQLPLHSTKTVRCRAEGHPTATITWYKVDDDGPYTKDRVNLKL